MKDEMVYLLHVSFCLSGFYFLYATLFKDTTFFMLNRIYLLSGVVLSFTIPALQLPIGGWDQHLSSTDLNMSSLMPALQRVVYDTDPYQPPSSFDLYRLMVILYWVGFAFVIARMLFSTAKIIQIKNRSRIHLKGDMHIVETGLGSPFSFFNFIFLPTLEVNPIIIEHERVHIVQRHWIDLVIMELVCALLWFNPIVFLYKRSIKLQHEYQADGSALRKGIHLEQYLHCMLVQIQCEGGIAPVSEFYSQTIKRRILMMTKNKTTPGVSALYLVSLPAICMLLFAFSNQPTFLLQNASVAPKEGQKIIIVDAGHGGQDAGATTADGIKEKDVVLSVAKEIQRVGQEKGIKVILTRSDDVGMELNERVSLANRFSADLFISLHANAHPQNQFSGLECIVSEDNTKFGESKRLAEVLVSHLKTLNGIAVNEVKKSNYYVLKNADVAAVMLELGYLSNKNDYTFVVDDKNHKLLSEQIIAAVLSYTN